MFNTIHSMTDTIRLTEEDIKAIRRRCHIISAIYQFGCIGMLLFVEWFFLYGLESLKLEIVTWSFAAIIVLAGIGIARCKLWGFVIGQFLLLPFFILIPVGTLFGYIMWRELNTLTTLKDMMLIRD